jgi:Uma2 family endonuclease
LRAPDVAFVSTQRLGAEDQAGFFDGPPDLAVEVVSPNDRAYEVAEKTRHWLDAGARAVWVVWPDTRSVTVHYPGRDPIILHEGDTLDGGDVVPGFTCDVAAIFE